MAMAIEKSEAFHLGGKQEEFAAYLERLEYFFVAKRLTYGDEKSEAVNLTIVGRKNHTLLLDFWAPLKLLHKKSYGN